MGAGGPSSVGSVHGNMPASVATDNPQLTGSSLSNLLNGNEMNMELKQSPSSTQANVPMNGGTPAQHGPGSIAGPSSVHSQTGAPNSVNANTNSQQPPQSTPQSHAAQLTPTSMLDYQQNNDNPGNEEGKEEIAKIKASLIEDYGLVANSNSNFNYN